MAGTGIAAGVPPQDDYIWVKIRDIERQLQSVQTIAANAQAVANAIVSIASHGGSALSFTVGTTEQTFYSGTIPIPTG